MSEREKHIGQLFTAELQFRFASADGKFDAPAMVRQFQNISTALLREIADFVSAKLGEYSGA